jgi:RimJ/RimL family protein N-acetyltransferase
MGAPTTNIVKVNVFLETERLILRQFTSADVDLLAELDGDPEVMFYLTGGVTTTRDEIRDDYLPAFMAYYQKSAGYGFWAAIEKSAGEFIGWFHFRPEPEHPDDEPELGYRLRKKSWGKGYATEGSIALIDKGFSEFTVRRVLASTMTVNRGSWHVMEKCGMRRIREFHQDWPYSIPGEDQGDVEYAITRDEWERQRRG